MKVLQEWARKHIVMLPCAPDVRMPFTGDETINIGAIVKATLAQPDRTLGRSVLGASEAMSCQEWASSLTQAWKRLGREHTDVTFVQCSLDACENLFGPLGTEIGNIFRFISEFGIRSLAGDVYSAPLTP